MKKSEKNVGGSNGTNPRIGFDEIGTGPLSSIFLLIQVDA